jgi:hypothetical protein
MSARRGTAIALMWNVRSASSVEQARTDKERSDPMLNRRQRLRRWLQESRMPKAQRLKARSERLAQMARDHEEWIADLGRATGEGHYSRAADFHRSQW